MTSTPVGLVVPQTAAMPRTPAVDDIGEFGRQLEDLGYDSAWMNESWGSDAFLVLMAIARATETLKIGTSIVNVFTRTPASIAMAAATLSELSDQRFTLGLGTGHPEYIEGVHGIKWERPLGKMRETISTVKRLLSNDGAFQSNSERFEQLVFDPLAEDVPVYTAALGRENRRLTGTLSDGWIPYNVPFGRLDAGYETIETAAREGGRGPDAVAVVPYVACVVSEDGSEAESILRDNIARYIGGFSDDSYKNAVGSSFADEADRIAASWRAGDQERAKASVSDAMMDALGIAGTPDKAREALRDLRRRPVVDGLILAIPHMASEELVRFTMREMAPG